MSKKIQIRPVVHYSAEVIEAEYRQTKMVVSQMQQDYLAAPTPEKFAEYCAYDANVYHPWMVRMSQLNMHRQLDASESDWRSNAD